jgi:uncharacterized damage-inducible protein DinB
MARDLIDQYAAGAEKLAQAIRGLTSEDLLAAPPPGGPEVGRWTIQQVVIHLADAESAFADRIKRIIAEDNATLQAWDENRFVERLHYHDQSAEDAVKIVELTRKQVARILKKLPDSAFARKGVHSARGPQTLIDVLNNAVPHLEHHLKFIHAKRAAMGKEMW